MGIQPHFLQADKWQKQVEREMGINNAYATESHVQVKLMQSNTTVYPHRHQCCTSCQSWMQSWFEAHSFSEVAPSTTATEIRSKMVMTMKMEAGHFFVTFLFFFGFSGDNLRHCGACCDVFLPGPIDPWGSFAGS